MKRLLLYFFILVFTVTSIPLLTKTFYAPTSSLSPEIHLLHAGTWETDSVPIEDFVIGAMDAMQLTVGEETRKAIAVALRSSALYFEQNRPRHPEAALCDDPDCCIPFVRTSFSDPSVRAVGETAGLFLSFADSPAACPLCPDAGGRTERCEAVFGISVPYLTSVKEIGAASRTVVRIPWAEILTAFGTERANSDDLSVACDRAGRVRELWLGDLTLDGQTFCKRLSLPSDLFTVQKAGTDLEITCFGQGNGLGLSIMGADALEKTGKGFRDILAFYFPGTEISAFH